MTPTNQCPEQYRNLSAADHCRLRNIRLGTKERPGRLPVNIIPVELRAPLRKRRDELLALIAKGPIQRSKLREQLSCRGHTLDNELSRLQTAGLVKVAKLNGRLVWQVTA